VRNLKFASQTVKQQPVLPFLFFKVFLLLKQIKAMAKIISTKNGICNTCSDYCSAFPPCKKKWSNMDCRIGRPYNNFKSGKLETRNNVDNRALNWKPAEWARFAALAQ
jgi:hypothetical protein